MTRRRLVGVAVVMLACLPASPAVPHMGRHEATFSAPAPCSVACPYWLDVLNGDVDEDGRQDVYFDACGNPTPWTEGTAYDDVLSEPVPEEADIVSLQIWPEVDADAFFCELEDSWDGDGIPNEEIALGACDCLDECDSWLPYGDLVGTGCAEKVTIPVGGKAGRRVIIRVFNWVEYGPVEGVYTFRAIRAG